MAAPPRLIGTAEIDINVKKVALEDMQSPPYKARVDFYIVYYSPADHSELKRALYPANFVLIFKTEAPNACPRFLADGPVEAECQLFHRLAWLGVLFVNIFPAAYTIKRKFLLKDTGRKLSHLDKQVVSGSAPVPAPTRDEE